MSHKNKLVAFSQQEGFQVTERSDRIILEKVPCLLEHQKISYCIIEKSFDPANEAPTGIEGDVHAVRITFSPGTNPCVYQANGHPIGNLISSAPQDNPPWVNISIRRGGPASPEKDETVWSLLHRYAKQIIGAVRKHEQQNIGVFPRRNVFRIPNTFEGRTGIGPMQERIKNQNVALIGLGGTGSYVLDLLVKTPIATIHLCDDDAMDWHNFMRAPGTPTQGEIDAQHISPQKKVEYYYNKYASLRNGVCPHILRVGDNTEFTTFLSEHTIDFAFVNIDQRQEGDVSRQDEVYDVLSEAGIPFVDSGISLTLEQDQIQGAVTTSSYKAGSLDWQQTLPNSKMTGNHPGYRNIQLPEVNALAAALAVMEWRRLTEQYVKDTKSFLHKFRLEQACIIWAQQNHENS